MTSFVRFLDIALSERCSGYLLGYVVYSFVLCTSLFYYKQEPANFYVTYSEILITKVTCDVEFAMRKVVNTVWLS